MASETCDFVPEEIPAFFQAVESLNAQHDLQEPEHISHYSRLGHEAPDYKTCDFGHGVLAFVDEQGVVYAHLCEEDPHGANPNFSEMRAAFDYLERNGYRKVTFPFVPFTIHHSPGFPSNQGIPPSVYGFPNA